MNFVRHINMKWIKPIAFSHCLVPLATWHGETGKAHEFHRT